MSRLSVTLCVVMLAVLALPLTAMAAGEQRVLIRYAYQLDDDPEVMRLADIYDMLSTSNVVFAQCAKEWVLTEDQKRYLDTRFGEISQEYMNAYVNAYTRRVGGTMPPSQEMVNQFQKALRDQQQKAVDKIAIDIQKGGCRSVKVERNLANFEKQRQEDMKPKPAPKPIKLKE